MVTIHPIYKEDEAQRIINQKWVIEKLTEVGDSLLKTDYKKNWTPTNPTYGYCYLVSELLYHYVYVNSTVYHLNMTAFGEYIHWFLKEDGKIIDLTGIQFNYIKPYSEEYQGRFFDFSEDDGIFLIPYAKAKRGVFFDGKYKTPRGLISDRAVVLGEKFGLLTLLKPEE